MAGDDGGFGECLRASRAAAGLSQEELAGRSGVSVRAIRDMERGRTRWPNYESARRLADTLGLADAKREGFLALARRPVAGPGQPGPVPVMVPYRGLSAFTEQDAGLFFGREEAAARVLGLMSGALGGSGLVVVSGVSGAGKSSLLAAGVLPGLREAGLAAAPEAAAWPCLVFTPGRSPLAELAARIAPLARADAAAIRRQLAVGPAGFAVTARQAALAAPGAGPAGAAGAGQWRVVLAVDQCEQLFTACPDPDERQAFITALCAAAAGEAAGCPAAAVVVLAVRADFEARLADYPQLNAAVQDRYLLTAMTRRQLRLAITRPAIAAGSAVDEDLVRVLLEEAAPATAAGGGAARAGALPLLSHVLDQAWRTRTATTITLAGYERAGGIEGAVAASAQRAYDALTGAQQEVARQVFTVLAAAGADGTDSAVPAARADLTAGGGQRAADAEAVLERFAAERLLTLDAATVAISHEVLLSAWPLLRDDWLADARADRITRTRLHATATEWTQACRDPSYLYTGTRLGTAAAAAARISADPRQLPLSQADHDFLHASRRAGHRRARTRRQLTALLLALIAALTTVSLIAVRAAQTAAAQRDIAASRLLISQSQALAGSNPALALKYSLAAWALGQSPQARYAMVEAAANPQAAVSFPAAPATSTAVAFSPDGKTLAVGSGSRTRLWNVAAGRQADGTLAEPNGSQAGSMAFSPDGKTLAVACGAGTWLWDVATGRKVGKPLPASLAGYAAAFSPDGRMLATGGYAGAQLWDAATGRQIGPPLPDGSSGYPNVSSVAFSPDGQMLATSSAAGVQLWDVATRRQIGRRLATLDGSIVFSVSYSVAFSPDGQMLATSSAAGVQLWDMATGKEFGRRLATLAVGPAPYVGSSVAFSPDGQMLATGGPTGVRLWDVATGRQTGVTLQGSAVFLSVAFSPDGSALAAGGPFGAWQWDLTAVPILQLTEPTSMPDPPESTVAFSPDGKTLAVGSGSRTRLWNVAAGRQADGTLAEPNGSQAGSMAFSPDGKTLAVACGAGTWLWDVATGRKVGKPLPASLAGYAAAFSPDGRMLATGGYAGAQLWDAATGRQIGPPLPDGGGTVYSVAFSRDGQMLATGGYTGAQLWDAATGRQFGRRLATLDGSTVFYSVAFSPDSQMLATGGYTGAQLWDVATGKEFGRRLATLDGGYHSPVAFSPDSKTLATGDGPDAQLWDVATGDLIAVTQSNSNNLGYVGVAFSPDGTMLAATGLSGVALWNVGYLTETLAQLCAQAGGSFTPAEWASDAPPGTPYHDVCPQARTR